MLKHLPILLFPFLAIGDAQAQENATPIPPSLVVDGEIIDRENGFAIKINPSAETWSVSKDKSTGATKYIGINKEAKTIYVVSVDPRRFDEANRKNAEQYRSGVHKGLTASGATIHGSSLEPSAVPRKNSFRMVTHATFSNGGQGVLVEHFTSPGRLYSIATLLPEGADEAGYLLFLQTFRLLDRAQ